MHNPTDIHNPMDLHTFKHIKNGLKYMYLIIHNPMDLIENGLIHMYM